MSAAIELFDPEIAFEAWVPGEDLVVADGVEEIRLSCGSGLPLGPTSQIGLGRRSGAEAELPVFSVWTFRAEKMIRLKFTPSRQAALEAAGLSE